MCVYVDKQKTSSPPKNEMLQMSVNFDYKMLYVIS